MTLLYCKLKSEVRLIVGCPMFNTQTPESSLSDSPSEVALYANGRIGLDSDFGVSMCVMSGSGSNVSVKNKLFFI